MNIFKKIFNFNNDEACAIGLCKFMDEDDDMSLKDTKKRAKIRYKKEISVTQMLKRTV